MKVGFRVPNLKKSFKARTTGAVKRKVKRKVVPLYGKNGVDFLTDPKKAIYNKVYKKVTVSSVPYDEVPSLFGRRRKNNGARRAAGEKLAAKPAQKLNQEKIGKVLFLLLRITIVFLVVMMWIGVIYQFAEYEARL